MQTPPVPAKSPTSQIPRAGEPALPNRWYGIARSQSVGSRPLAVQRFGLPLVLWRQRNGQAVAMLDRCPHRGAALSLGRTDGDALRCGYHGFRFDPSGACTDMPCEGSAARIPAGMTVPVFALREGHGLLWLWWGAPPEALGLSSLPPLPWQPQTPSGPDVASAVMDYEWPVPFHLAVESNFDGAHAPILHGGAFGVPLLGQLTLMESIEAAPEPDGVRMRATLRDPHGKSAKTFALEMHVNLSGVSLIQLDRYMTLISIDAPIDGERTWRCLFHLRPSGATPIIGNLLVKLLQLVDYHLTQVRQDLPTVRSLRVPVPGVYGDRLVRADAGLAKFVHLRRKASRLESSRRSALPPLIRWASGWTEPPETPEQPDSLDNS
jgi:nitrite reductase/ring-hydroxylating ferredoxin subunit